MEIINKLYFSIFVFSLIVLVDLLIKFKRPLILKFYFALLAICVGLYALTFTLSLEIRSFLFLLSLYKGLICYSIINIFTILYFPKFRNWINVLGVIYLIFEVLLFQYFRSNPFLFHSLGQKPMVLMMITSVKFPLLLNLYRILLHFLFLGVMVYTSISIVLKHQYHNIYFDKIKTWSKLLLAFSILMFLLFVPLSFVNFPNLIRYFASSVSFLILLLFIFYRPIFLNRSSLKISLGDIFNRDAEHAISELDFINEFYTKHYYLENDASLENFAIRLKISSNDLYKFIYYNYSMTFNDLVNKNRVDYFIEIIHNPKYLNFTIDALAKEAGFSSRQHLYKPFKKFHGGNPSDIIDAVAV